MPTLVYDGECGFCRRCIEWLRPQTTDIEYIAYQERGSRFPEVPVDEFQRAVQYIDESGQRKSGADAIYESCRRIPGLAGLSWLYDKLMPFRAASDRAYAWVASHRPLVSRISRWGLGADFTPSSYRLVRWLFLRGLGFVYATAFISLFFQIPGLFGVKGLAPAAEFLERVSRHYGAARFYELPTLAWFSASDGFLQAICAVGILAAIALGIGFWSRLSAFLCWLCYLSLTGAGGTFMQYQWESLLLEVGFLAVFLAPAGLWRRLADETPPSRIVVFLYRWLLFRLMFASGVTKLVSGDATWWDLTALSYHFETQPLPTWVGWYLHQLPRFMLQIGTLAMFLVELIASLLILFPRRPRRWAFWPIVGLQIVIFLTGNYTYFNYLAILLCFFLLDDKVLLAKLPILSKLGTSAVLFRAGKPWRRWGMQFLLGVFVLCGTVRVVQAFGAPRPEFFPFSSLFNWTNRLHIVTGYGLFSVMTTRRDELVIEGSDDEKEWKPYLLPAKPQALGEAPGFVAPHQPRLDWQMWFASLGLFENQKWLQRLSYRLLTNEPAALSLFAENPFPDKPPKALRILRYRYQFTTFTEKAATGHWWKRRLVNEYSPVLSLE